jgi:predicted nucleic acid-binding protein
LADEEKAKDIIRRYTDKTFSYTDAASFAVMERLGVREAFGLDPHFQQYGLKLLA